MDKEAKIGKSFKSKGKFTRRRRRKAGILRVRKSEAGVPLCTKNEEVQEASGSSVLERAIGGIDSSVNNDASSHAKAVFSDHSTDSLSTVIQTMQQPPSSSTASPASRSKRVKRVTTAPSLVFTTDRKTRSSSSSALSFNHGNEKVADNSKVKSEFNSNETKGFLLNKEVEAHKSLEKGATSDLSKCTVSSEGQHNDDLMNCERREELRPNGDTSLSVKAIKLEDNEEKTPNLREEKPDFPLQGCAMTNWQSFEKNTKVAEVLTVQRGSEAKICEGVTTGNSNNANKKAIGSTPKEGKCAGSFPSPEPKVNCKKKVDVTDEKNFTFAPMLLMNNLPYMGELTFDTRPRRGRKPKKADICHLITKNYGIHFPNPIHPEKGPSSTVTADNKGLHKKSKNLKSNKGWRKLQSNQGTPSASYCPQPQTSLSSSPSSSSLGPPWSPLNFLQLTQSKSQFPRINFDKGVPLTSSLSHIGMEFGESNMKPNAKREIQNMTIAHQKQKVSHDEPLNLCVRDTSMSSGELNRGCSEKLKLKLPLLSSNLFSGFHLKSNAAASESNTSLALHKKASKDGESAKKFKSAVNTEKHGLDQDLVNQLCFHINLARNNNNIVESAKMLKAGFRPSHLASSSSPVSHIKSEKVRSKKRPLASVMKRGSSSRAAVGQQEGPPNPVPGHSEPGRDANAQVSICKFKFTGGAKPSLQEKKMLSVDAGGNFRFYTDKDKVSSSVQVKGAKSQGPSSSLSHTESPFLKTDQSHHHQYPYFSLPKSAKSMSVCMPVRPFSLQLPSRPVTGPAKVPERLGEGNSEDLGGATTRTTIPLTPTAQQLNILNLDEVTNLNQPLSGEDEDSSSQSSESTPSFPSTSCASAAFNSSTGQYSHDVYTARKLRLKRKRRTRKSLAREKLEKTFREKGFLIQTQQLESAEGATYCKFRQLRKFTRYLFRSWKDYLPDNVKEINGVNSNSASGVNITSTFPEDGGVQRVESMNEQLQTSDGGVNEGDAEGREGTLQAHLEASDEGDDEYDGEEEEEVDMDLVPEITVIPQPSSPLSDSDKPIGDDDA